METEAYQRAERLLAHHRSELVEGGTVTPRWIDDGARFAYEDHLVDPIAGTREPGAPEDEGHPDPMEVRSPDKRWVVSSREHDLWARDLATGEEKRLTSDGVPDRAYAVQPDALTYGVAMRRLGLPSLPPLVAWSPDSRRVLTHRTVQAGVGLAHLVEAAPPGGGRPLLHTYHYALPGDEVVPTAELVVIDVETGEVVEAKTEPLFTPMLSPLLYVRRAWWSADGDAVYFLDQPRDLKRLTLKRMDPATGDVRTMVEETGAPRVEPGQGMGKAMVEVLPEGNEVVWYSQRDGWGHLYLYADGELRNRITSGDWAVQEILHIDPAGRVVYFTASGLVEQDPLRRQVCRTALDGTGFARLTEDDLDHAVTVPPGVPAYFIDSASSKTVPPVITARGWDGTVLVELERADITGLRDAGWTEPEQFRAKAADGVTDIYGVLYKPYGFDPAKKYPVVDSPYPGPHHGRVTPSFAGMPWIDCEAEAIAALGFVVVTVDGRGQPGRDRAFHDASYGRYDTAGYLEDHVAAFRQLAETRPWMDLDRVGVYGDSGGGYATVRALCRFPEFYKVGVAGCGNHDQSTYHLAWGETYDGPYDEELYRRSSNLELADRLEGKLLLIHGEMDDNVHPHQTLRLVDRLVAANKDFELLVVPGAEHLYLGYESYVRRRRWDFLVRHLLGEEPPKGYRLAEVPLDPALFFGSGG